MNRHGASTLALLLATALSVTAQAEPAKEEALSIQPHTGAFLKLTEKEKRAVGSFSHLSTDGVRMDLTVSAPLDSESREAALTAENAPASGIAGTVALGYDSRQKSLELSDAERAPGDILTACKVLKVGTKPKVGQAACWSDDLISWYEDFKKSRVLDCDADEATCANVKRRLLLNEACPAADTKCAQVARVWEHLVARDRQRKNIDRYFLPDTSNTYWAFVGELSYSFDRIRAYDRANIAPKAGTYNSYAFDAGPRFDLYFAPSVAISLRAGYTLNREVQVQSFERCRSLPSDDETVTGQACEDTRALKSTPSAESSFYSRLALTYVGQTVTQGTVPGAELRLSADRIGQDAEATIRVSTFLSPITGPVLSRFGIGVDFFVPIDPEDEDVEAGALREVRPFVMIGASL